jgi:hypothetical protein
MSGDLTLEKKSLSAKITFQKRYPQYIGEIRSVWMHKSTKVQLEEMPHKQDILLIKGIQLIQMFGN